MRWTTLCYSTLDSWCITVQHGIAYSMLTHRGRVTHICVSKLTIIGSDNGLSPDRRQAIIWTNAGLLFIGSLGTNFSEILIEILTFSFKKMRLKVSSAKRRPFCFGLNVLITKLKSSSYFKLTKDTLFIPLIVELLSTFCELFVQEWTMYVENVLHVTISSSEMLILLWHNVVSH